MRVVALYAGLLAILFIALGLRTVVLRRRLRIPVGDGGDPALQRAARAHANFAEYVPFALLLLLLLAGAGARPVFLHVLGGALLAGRVLHALGVSRVREQLRWRISGMVLTFGVIGTAAARLLVFALR